MYIRQVISYKPYINLMYISCKLLRMHLKHGQQFNMNETKLSLRT